MRSSPRRVWEGRPALPELEDLIETSELEDLPAAGPQVFERHLLPRVVASVEDIHIKK